MSVKKKENQLFFRYFEDWIELYKVGAVRDVTLNKYYMALQKLELLAPNLRMYDLDRQSYQQILNDYAFTHEKQTTMDFHHQLKGAILDAVDERIIDKNPTRKVIIKERKPRPKKIKFLNQFELQALLKNLDLNDEINWDWFILLVAKTGLRFSEALALTPNDFDFSKQSISVEKTWDYKSSKGGMQNTKNKSSNRKVIMDWQVAMQFSQMIRELDPEKPIFVKGRIYNSMINKRLRALCIKADIPIISIHGLRHTHVVCQQNIRQFL